MRKKLLKDELEKLKANSKIEMDRANSAYLISKEIYQIACRKLKKFKAIEYDGQSYSGDYEDTP